MCTSAAAPAIDQSVSAPLKYTDRSHTHTQAESAITLKRNLTPLRYSSLLHMIMVSWALSDYHLPINKFFTLLCKGGDNSSDVHFVRLAVDQFTTFKKVHWVAMKKIATFADFQPNICQGSEQSVVAFGVCISVCKNASTALVCDLNK